MSDDFLSLRMIVIVAALPDQQLWRQAAAMASVMIEFDSPDAASAVGALAKTGTDICVVDAALSDTDKTAVIAAARAAQPAPLVFGSGSKGAKLAGIDGMLTKPASAEEARKLVEVCVRARLPTRVLIVDDSGTMRSIVRKILSVSYFALDIHEAAEGKAALDQLRAGNFAVVFLDYNMPGLSGFETLLEIKRECPKVAVVMMTSTLDSGIAAQARAVGAFDSLKKPFFPADINAVLERLHGMNVPRG
jgi:CheY-like chemotaxis protein